MTEKRALYTKTVAVICCILLLAVCLIKTNGRPTAAVADGVAAKTESAVSANTSREEKFFGKWNNGAWQIEPRLDYSYAGLERVEQCVMLGDYSGAKDALLSYYKRRDTVRAISPYAETSMAADLMLSNIIAWNFSDYLSYATVTSKEDWYSFSVLGGVTLGMQVGFELTARGKRDDLAVFSSKEGLYSPYLELNVNGVKEVVYPVKDATVRAGDYRTQNYGYNQTLEVNDTGYPADSDSRRAILVFDLSKYSGLVSSANLYVHGKTTQSEVEIMALKHVDIAWNENTLSYSVANLKVYSWEGNMSAWDWRAPDGCTEQYELATLTGNFIYYLTRAYHATRRAEYAQKAIEMLVCISKWGGDKPYLGDPLRTGNRGETMTNHFGYLVKTPYMTAQDCFDIVYYMYVQAEWLGNPLLEYPKYCTSNSNASYNPTSNWGVTQTNGLYYSSHYFYEFTGAQAWQELSEKRFSDLIDDLINVDGSYNEDCTSYVSVTLDSAYNIVEFANQNGFSLPASTEMRIMNLLGYVMTYSMPNTMDPNYGDASATSTVELIRQYVETYGEEGELLYYISRGSMGTEPTYTSRYYSFVNWAIMRSGWDEDDLYMHVNTQSGTHNHWDSNAVIMYAYGRNLLIDSGRKSYDDIDADTIWQRKNVESHNTLQMDDKSGNAAGFYNEVRAFDTTDLADIYQGYNEQCTDAGHTRTVLMIKDGFYIVSDYVKNMSGANRKYTLNWHMGPNSDFTVDIGSNKTSTHFSTGANLQIIPSVTYGNVEIKTNGRLTTDSLGEAIPYDYVGYSYSQTANLNVSTLLYPTREGDTQDVTMQAIALSDNSPDAQAAVINFDSTRGNHTAYYYLSNESTPLNRSYAGFTANGMLAYTEYDNSGNIVRIVYRGGTVLSGGAGEILSSPLKLALVAAAYEGDALILQGNLVPCTDKSKAVKIYAPNIAQVTVNGESVPFEREGDYVYAAMSSESVETASVTATVNALGELADLQADDADAVSLARAAVKTYQAKGFTVSDEILNKLDSLEAGLVLLKDVDELIEYLRLLMPDGVTMYSSANLEMAKKQFAAFAAKNPAASEMVVYKQAAELLELYAQQTAELKSKLSGKTYVEKVSLRESLDYSVKLEADGAGKGQGYNGFYYKYVTVTNGSVKDFSSISNPESVYAQGSYKQSSTYFGSQNIAPGKNYGVLCFWRAETDCVIKFDMDVRAMPIMDIGYTDDANGVNVYVSRGTATSGYPYKITSGVLGPASTALFAGHVDNTVLKPNPLSYTGIFELQAGEGIWICIDAVDGNNTQDRVSMDANISILHNARYKQGANLQEVFDAAERIQNAFVSLPDADDITLTDASRIRQTEADLDLFESPDDFAGYSEYEKARDACAALGVDLDSDSHAVTVLKATGGAVTANYAFAPEGMPVIISVTPDDGYEYVQGSLTVNGEPADSLVVAMPDNEVIISAQFAKKEYLISVDANKAGAEVKLSADKAAAGEKVYFSFELPYGRRIRSGSVKDNGQTVDGNYFVMPSSDAELTFEVEDIKSKGGCRSEAYGAVALIPPLVLLCAALLLTIFKRRKSHKWLRD